MKCYFLYGEDIDEELDEKKDELFNKIEDSTYFEKKLYSFIWDIIEDLDELTLDDFIHNLEYWVEYNDDRLWTIIREYSPIDNPIPLEKAINYLIDDIKDCFE